MPFEILETVRKGLNLSVERTKGRGVASLAQFDRGFPAVKLGEKISFHLLQLCANPPFVFFS